MFLSSKPKGVRLGYMGHLTLISEDVIIALGHFPADLRATILHHAPKPDWDEYVNGRYNETKSRDTSLLGGGKPVLSGAPTRPSSQWKVDEEDTRTLASGSTAASEMANNSTVQGEFRRAADSRPTRENSADFGPAPVVDNEGFPTTTQSDVCLFHEACHSCVMADA